MVLLSNSGLYERSVTRFIFKNYSWFVNSFLHLILCGDNVFICKSCHSKIKKKKVPCQAVAAVNWIFIKRIIPAGNYLLKVNNRNTRTRCELCPKLKKFIFRSPKLIDWLEVANSVGTFWKTKDWSDISLTEPLFQVLVQGNSQ